MRKGSLLPRISILITGMLISSFTLVVGIYIFSNLIAKRLRDFSLSKFDILGIIFTLLILITIYMRLGIDSANDYLNIQNPAFLFLNVFLYFMVCFIAYKLYFRANYRECIFFFSLGTIFMVLGVVIYSFMRTGFCQRMDI